MKRSAIFAAALAFAASTPAFAAEPITGRWMTEDKDAVVTIAKCGSSYCGRISRFLVPPPQGADQRDTNNPDPAKRSRKLMGLPVLFSFAEDDDLWRGRIYDPKSGKDYRSVVRRKSASRLEVKGCLGPICQTQNWTRAN
ncbi:DUF2147 domain-containing protein [Qipengyuania spongiae]|uniref:DUF2147 domain-containing protein n=1 Tax=Qipengyuania spongiae TaxID=2909673 RepID=A0ABY5T004_9SPHN|nr:DUF2147 domain-containing protein [Qipengyuania spongiae]UVI39755.1 DUF2147 domain-containing protein [Qipengyuania spongiae]